MSVQYRKDANWDSSRIENELKRKRARRRASVKLAKYYDVAFAAKVLGMSEETANFRIRLGLLAHDVVLKPGGEWERVVPAKAVKAILAERQAKLNAVLDWEAMEAERPRLGVGV